MVVDSRYGTPDCLPLISWAKAQEIHLICVPPECSGIVRPLDLASRWVLRREWYPMSGKTLTKGKPVVRNMQLFWSPCSFSTSTMPRFIYGFIYWFFFRKANWLSMSLLVGSYSRQRLKWVIPCGPSRPASSTPSWPPTLAPWTRTTWKWSFAPPASSPSTPDMWPLWRSLPMSNSHYSRSKGKRTNCRNHPLRPINWDQSISKQWETSLTPWPGMVTMPKPLINYWSRFMLLVIKSGQ